MENNKKYACLMLIFIAGVYSFVKYIEYNRIQNESDYYAATYNYSPILTSLKLYKELCGKFPTTSEGLISLKGNKTCKEYKPSQQMLNHSLYNGYGIKFEYNSDGINYEVKSKGKTVNFIDDGKTPFAY